MHGKKRHLKDIVKNGLLDVIDSISTTKSSQDMFVLRALITKQNIFIKLTDTRYLV